MTEPVIASDGPQRLAASEAHCDVAVLLVFYSPVFPVGGYAYSQGLEWAVASGAVQDGAGLAAWCEANLARGGLVQDLALLSMAVRAPDVPAFESVRELATALQPSRERAEETALLGRAFLDAYVAGWPEAEFPDHIAAATSVPLPIAAASVAKCHPVPLGPMLRAHAVASLQNTISAAIRLSVIGAFEGHRILASLLAAVETACARAATAVEADLGTSVMAADLASLHHETQTTRLFRS